jgi:hypothetical protein
MSVKITPANPSPSPRRRGGQPGNCNARNNRGNRFAHGKRGNRGGGAPFANQNARRERNSLDQTLLSEYQHIPDAVEWLERHSQEIREAVEEFGPDRASYFGSLGLTPEVLSSRGLEYKYRLYTDPDFDTDGEE